MSKPVKDLEPGSIYVTISLQRTFNGSTTSPAHGRNHGTSCEIDIATYETHCAQDLAQEEFSWGLYFHRGNRDGIWYNLTRSHDPKHESYSPIFLLDRQHVNASPRLRTQVVGLVRVLRIPQSLSGELTWYLDWLAWESYGTASRTFIWVTSLYLRTWHHSIRMLTNPTVGHVLQFDVNLFLLENLNFAYENIDYALGGQLPRPIIKSAYGAELGILGEEGIQKNFLQGQQRAAAKSMSIPNSSS